jgi:hypothetical protein
MARYIYAIGQMRRALSISLVLLLWLGPFAAVLPGIDESRLPLCCRRHGVHHCADADKRFSERGFRPVIQGFVPLSAVSRYRGRGENFGLRAGCWTRERGSSRRYIHIRRQPGCRSRRPAWHASGPGPAFPVPLLIPFRIVSPMLGMNTLQVLTCRGASHAILPGARFGGVNARAVRDGLAPVTTSAPPAGFP